LDDVVTGGGAFSAAGFSAVSVFCAARFRDFDLGVTRDSTLPTAAFASLLIDAKPIGGSTVAACTASLLACPRFAFDARFGLAVFAIKMPLHATSLFPSP
jgi:hypothetical protein